VRDKVGLPSEAVLSVSYLAAVMISVNIQHIRTHTFLYQMAMCGHHIYQAG
jgi:hypothetical protein